MNRKTFGTIAAIALGVALAMPAYAAQKEGSMKGMEMKGSMAMGHEIHKSTVDGYTLVYRLMDMKQKMEAMKGMPGMKGMSMQGMDMSQMKSHHLMVFITSPDGKPVEDVKAGYKVTGPDGGEQMTMTMPMSGGMGADVDLKAKGTYDIKCKVVAGGKTLIDEFKYDVK